MSIILYRYFPIVLIYVSFLLVKINIRISLVSIFSIDRDLFTNVQCCSVKCSVRLTRALDLDIGF